MNSYQAAKLVYDALKADPLAQAHGVKDCVLLNSAVSREVFGSEVPSVSWEGGPVEWAIAVTGGDSLDSDYRGDLGQGVKDALAKVREGGYYFECHTSYALGAYRA